MAKLKRLALIAIDFAWRDLLRPKSATALEKSALLQAADGLIACANECGNFFDGVKFSLACSAAGSVCCGGIRAHSNSS